MASAENDSTKRVQKFVGEIRKCPNCGQEVGSFQAICPSCGHEFTDVGVNKSIQEFFSKVSDDSKSRAQTLPPLRANKVMLVVGIISVVSAFIFEWRHSFAGFSYGAFSREFALFPIGLFVILASFFVPAFREMEAKDVWANYANKILLALGIEMIVPTVIYSISDFDYGEVANLPVILLGVAAIFSSFLVSAPMTAEDKKKKDIIETFVVPNTREALLEFATLACSMIKPETNLLTAIGKQNARWNEIWHVKLNQTLQKASISFAGDAAEQAAFSDIQKKSDEALKKANKSKQKSQLVSIAFFVVLGSIWVWYFIF